MLEALLISNLLLWVLVVVLAAVVVALVRQVGVLNERIAPVGALVGREEPRVGEVAPRFELPDWAGTLQTIGGADAQARQTLLMFVSPTCPVCKTMLSITDAVARERGHGLRVVWASDGVRAEHEEFVRTHGMAERGYVLSTELGLGYQVAKLPYAVLLDAQGIVRGKGLVNTREHLESLFEALERGVGSVQEYLQQENDRRQVA
jgi:methylamine dehydrogenase accessory protein MauD